METESEIIEEVTAIIVEIKTNKGRKRMRFTNLVEPKLNNIHSTKDVVRKGACIGKETKEKYKQIIFDCADIMFTDIIDEDK